MSTPKDIFDRTLMDPDWLRENAEDIERAEGPAWRGFTVRVRGRDVTYRVRIAGEFDLRWDVSSEGGDLAHNLPWDAGLHDFFSSLSDMEFKFRDHKAKGLRASAHTFLLGLEEPGRPKGVEWVLPE